MSGPAKIMSVDPVMAIAGGEIEIDGVGFGPGIDKDDGCFVDGIRCRVVARSNHRIVAIIPDGAVGENAQLYLENGGVRSNLFEINVGRQIAKDMHLVANPAIDPSDNAIILTRSGSRGQHIPVSMFRLEEDGYLDELPDSILNPTGVAFDQQGLLYVSNRAQGEIAVISREGTSSVYATALGIATGIAFDPEGVLYVGDRKGRIFRIRDFGAKEQFATLEPSVAAYHLAFGPDGRLYVTAPSLASHDSIYAVDKDGHVTSYVRGFGRPQGLAFDTNGDLYVAASHKGRRGVFKVSSEGAVERVVAGMNVVGLCMSRKGELIVATNDSVYSIDCNIKGTLLSETSP